MSRAILMMVWLVAGYGCRVYDCMSHDLQVVAEGTRVQSMTLHGPGCANAVMDSDLPVPGVARTSSCGKGFAPNCQYYYLAPHAVGDCVVHFVFEDGQTLDKTATFEHLESEHCGGYYSRAERSWELGALLADAGTR
ncbi:MAG TPA: hypothetical protein VF331_16225 [Polyangiales bacterium]